MSSQPLLLDQLQAHFGKQLDTIHFEHEMITLEVPKQHLISVCSALYDEPKFHFKLFIDMCGVDYKDYGRSEWVTEPATDTSFERAVNPYNEQMTLNPWGKPRFAAVYHLLSIKHNHRLRLRCFTEIEAKNQEKEAFPTLDSVMHIWSAANWYEREAFDLYGILFKGHPDLRRILTDYGFVGHPFRKDFPLIGYKEVRYDAAEGKVIYESVSSVTPRTLVPKVIRKQTNNPIE